MTRRLFLTGLGAGTAGLVAGAPGIAHAIDETGQVAPTQTRADRFGRMFPELPPFAPANNTVRAALRDIGKPGGLLDPGTGANPDNEFHTAGTTFFGQFLDHDMTFDTTSELGFPTPPEQSPNARTPALDLDSVYGGGPAANPALYQSDRVKLRIESGGRFEDLPREPDGTAIIADPRNDEHVMIGGIHAAVILFHNQVVDRLRSEGVTSGLFNQARRLVTWHYQWIILNEFLRQVVGFGVTTQILKDGRRFYRPEPGPAFIPVEFQGAVYRFGHSMVRPAYRANRDFAAAIFDVSQNGLPDPQDLRGGVRAPRRFVDWQFFFDFGDGAVARNKRIDRRVSPPLFNLPLQTIPDGSPPTALPQRNLLRHLTWELPSGQAVANRMQVSTFPLPELAQYGLGLDTSTPLWYYALAEAELIRDGIELGPMGGRLVGEVMVGLIQLDPGSFLRVQPNFRPTLPSRTPGDFKMVDLLNFAGVGPASRGQ